jgi:hypothetical protein
LWYVQVYGSYITGVLADEELELDDRIETALGVLSNVCEVVPSYFIRLHKSESCARVQTVPDDMPVLLRERWLGALQAEESGGERGKSLQEAELELLRRQEVRCVSP